MTHYIIEMPKLLWIPNAENFVLDEIDEAKKIKKQDHNRRISKAPLHWLWPSCRNIPPKELLKIRQKGYEVERGHFTKKEDKRIKENWERWARHFPTLSDPFVAFGCLIRPPPNDDQESEKIELYDSDIIFNRSKRKLRKFFFFKRLAYKLDKRLICDIYPRAKKILVYHQFEHEYLSQCDEQLIEEVRKKVKDENKSGMIVSSECNISPQVVTAIKHRKPYVERPYRWAEVDEYILEECIERQFKGYPSTREVPSYMIDWKRIEREMKLCGYELKKEQIYKKWRRMNPSVFGLPKVH